MVVNAWGSTLLAALVAGFILAIGAGVLYALGSALVAWFAVFGVLCLSDVLEGRERTEALREGRR